MGGVMMVYPKSKNGSIIAGILFLIANYSSDIKAAIMALVTFFFVDFLDTTGTFLAVVQPIPGVMKEDGDFEGSRIAFSIDAISTMIGSVFGLSPVTSFIES